MLVTQTVRTPTIVPFADEHLDGGALLLAERHRAHRLAEPGLDPRYEAPGAAREELGALLRVDGASGVAGLIDGDVAGFVVGTPRDASWGPNMWVEPAGHAVTDAELVRDLYATAAERWVADGLALHYAMVPASDRALVDAWFRLGFGHQQVYAIRETPPATERTEAPPGLVVRLARLDDLDALARLDVALPAHQALSPVFSRRALPTVEDARAEYEADFDDPRFATFVVEREGEVIGSAIACAIELSSDHKSLALPPGAGFLGFASVLPEARGRGAGRVLGEAVLEWARETEREWVVTDWRMTNLLSSRAWPRLGFRPTYYRLHRAIA
ncbi:MAG: GNAT family N-acetyltransferase [Gaiella sp.]|uniref:GNAT family N-acetyltransferase n=1 Tax=Gaiella sp. TaxID=2663207 RepID=UPI003C734AF2